MSFQWDVACIEWSNSISHPSSLVVRWKLQLHQITFVTFDLNWSLQDICERWNPIVTYQVCVFNGRLVSPKKAVSYANTTIKTLCERALTKYAIIISGVKKQFKIVIFLYILCIFSSFLALHHVPLLFVQHLSYTRLVFIATHIIIFFIPTHTHC